ncbi:cyclic pyranopterin monophosphate synthase MoaC [Candidatus Bathyarchaeota archaeon]|nr:MAG: cyclic pyranopterin monophosphate synthase MoaC [Candidatus Bathyarchaeota archaeon]
MVDISGKPEVYREAKARGIIRLKPQTIKLIKEGKISKGDPITVAKVAATLAAKNTSSLIPLCHQIPLTNVSLKFEFLDGSRIAVESTVRTKAQTGVEMEALAAVSTALLTIWDMTKQYEKDEKGEYPNTTIEHICVLRKIKGKPDERDLEET